MPVHVGITIQTQHKSSLLEKLDLNPTLTLLMLRRIQTFIALPLPMFPEE